MFRHPRSRLSALLALVALTASAWAGSLKKDYFSSTKPGAWVEHTLASPDGSKTYFSYERQADDNGHPVVEMVVKVLEGAGKDSKTILHYILPKDFSFEREGLNYGKYTEKMLAANNGGADMEINASTLDIIRKSEKDFHDAVTFEGTEKVEGHDCDRYSYAITIGGPNPTKEVGKLWLDSTVPFGVVRQQAKVSSSDGKVLSEFDMRLKQTGVNQLLAEAAPTPAEPPKMALPSEVTLVDGFNGGRVGIDVEVVAGSAGRKLSFTLTNKGEAGLTVTAPAGEMAVEADSPIHTLKVKTAKAIRLQIPAGESAAPFVVEQRSVRGPVEGKFSISVYEGTPIYSGSTTIGTVGK